MKAFYVTFTAEVVLDEGEAKSKTEAIRLARDSIIEDLNFSFERLDWKVEEEFFEDEEE